MCYRPISILLLLTALSSIAIGQPDKDLKKKLESDLYKKTPYVRSAKLDGCRLVLSVDITYNSGFNPTVGAMPAAMPTEGEMNPPFASGSGSRNLVQFFLSLDKLDRERVDLAAAKRKDHKTLLLSGKSDAITRIWSGKRDRTGSLDLTVNSKDADRVAETLREAIAACT